MRKSYKFVLLILVLVVLEAAVPFAPDISIDWWAIGPGSQTSTVDSVTLESMIGQPVAGATSLGTTQLNSGFLQALWEFLGNLFLPMIVR